MTEQTKPVSKRQSTREASRARREARANRQAILFDLVASGYSYEAIADKLVISAATVRREVGRALDASPLDAPERYARLQVARLNKALRAADAALERGDLKAVGPLVKVVAELDRYHGLAGRRAPAAPALPAPPPGPAPLQLTHAAPAMTALVGIETVAENGA